MIARTLRSTMTLFLAAALVIGTIAPPARADVLDDVSNAELAVEWQAALVAYQFTTRLPSWAFLGLRRQVTRVLTIDIAVPRDHVFEVYSDIDNHIGRHPFLKAVVTHKEYDSNGLHVRNFTAIEDVPLAGVPVRLHTNAQQRTRESTYSYESDSYDVPGVITHQTVTFQDLGNGTTRVTENLVFESDVATIDFTVDNGVSSHLANQIALKRDLENGTL